MWFEVSTVSIPAKTLGFWGQSKKPRIGAALRSEGLGAKVGPKWGETGVKVCMRVISLLFIRVCPFCLPSFAHVLPVLPAIPWAESRRLNVAALPWNRARRAFPWRPSPGPRAVAGAAAGADVYTGQGQQWRCRHQLRLGRYQLRPGPARPGCRPAAVDGAFPGDGERLDARPAPAPRHQLRPASTSATGTDQDRPGAGTGRASGGGVGISSDQASTSTDQASGCTTATG